MDQPVEQTLGPPLVIGLFHADQDQEAALNAGDHRPVHADGGLGIGWASIMGNPYIILASLIPPKRTGVYMGIFNRLQGCRW